MSPYHVEIFLIETTTKSRFDKGAFASTQGKFYSAPGFATYLDVSMIFLNET